MLLRQLLAFFTFCFSITLAGDNLASQILRDLQIQLDHPDVEITTNIFANTRDYRRELKSRIQPLDSLGQSIISVQRDPRDESRIKNLLRSAEEKMSEGGMHIAHKIFILDLLEEAEHYDLTTLNKLQEAVSSINAYADRIESLYQQLVMYQYDPKQLSRDPSFMDKLRQEARYQEYGP